MAIEETADSGFDIGAAMDTVASAMAPEPEQTTTDAAPVTEAPEASDTETEPVSSSETPAVRQPPKSWAKDKHEIWSKLPSDAQDYYEQREKQMLDGLEQYKGDATYARQLKEVVTPYKAMLESMGVSETDAVKYLLNAQYQLTNGSEQQRRAAYERIGAELGFITQQAQEAAPVDPIVKQLQDKLNRIESDLTATRRQEHAQVKAKADSEVQTFASDPVNLYFGEVAQDMVPFIQQGLPLKDAYDRAVWANPATRAKEQARLQTEATAKLKEKAKPEVEAARRAASTNVRGAESRREPTEPTGSMEDTMKQTLANLRRRVN